MCVNGVPASIIAATVDRTIAGDPDTTTWRSAQAPYRATTWPRVPVSAPWRLPSSSTTGTTVSHGWSWAVRRRVSTS